MTEERIAEIIAQLRKASPRLSDAAVAKLAAQLRALPNG